VIWFPCRHYTMTRKGTLVQVSTMGAVLNGVYDGVLSIGALKEYGDFGIGTLERSDGELVGFDGNFYHIKVDGVAHPISDSIKTPFATATFFDVDHKEKLSAGMDYKQLERFLDEVLPTSNIFYAIKIEGAFSCIKARSVSRQRKPYPPAIEVVKNQPIFEFNDVEGAIVGFRCPAYISGINIPGYHLHFLTKGKDAGGHVLEFKTEEAVASLDYISEFLMILPGKDSDFYKVDLARDRQGELEKIQS